VKVLFIARHFTYFRNFDTVIERLAARGHTVHLAADREEALGGRDLVDRLVAQHPRVTAGFTPVRNWGRYTRLARGLRLGLDYLRYSDATYENMPEIRRRAHARTPAFVLALARLPFRRLVRRALEAVEEAVPRHDGVDDFVAGHAPDLLLITPLIELGSPQLDYVRAARRLGVRSALCVWSWDHLSSKALIRVRPDALIVWNDLQRDEASRFHGIAPQHVMVTGAQCFDRWFDRQPSRARADFCRRAGLPDDRPFLLYVCSALFRGSPSEAAFVRDWVRAIRSAADASVREMNLLVRPHPQRAAEWRDAGGPLEGAALWGSNPIDDESRADYFDSMYYSAGVVGLNTSALVEAAIVDRPVFTLLLPEFRDNQEGTFHFHHLMTAGNGFLHSARSLGEHVEQLAEVTRGADSGANRRFVEAFVRPRGASVPATPVFVDAVEELAARPVAAAPRRRWVVLLRPIVYALVVAGRLPLLERIYWNPAKFRQQAARRDPRALAQA
jgi:hypothetical protein